jgi:hypothetical protein
MTTIEPQIEPQITIANLIILMATFQMQPGETGLTALYIGTFLLEDPHFRVRLETDSCNQTKITATCLSEGLTVIYQTEDLVSGIAHTRSLICRSLRDRSEKCNTVLKRLGWFLVEGEEDE